MNGSIKRTLVCPLACIAMLLQVAACPAQEGSFDPTFGDGGRKLIDVSALSTDDSLVRLILRPDGKLLMGGTCGYIDHDVPDYEVFTFCVTQLNGDGTYDGNFGPGGLGYLQFDRFAGWPLNTDLVDMIVLHDGRIALLGYAVDDTFHSTQVLLAVLLADGSGLDTSVAGTGFMQFQFGSATSAPSSFVQQADDKILVAGGATGINGNLDFAAARLLADLSGFDSTFGSNGSTTVAFDLGGPSGDNFDGCLAVRLQSDGKIVMVGYGTTSPAGQPLSGAEFEVTRLDSNGTRDLAFGGNGDGRLHYTVNGDAVAIATDVQIDAADRIVIGGVAEATVGATSSEWVVDRLSRDGGRDATFNGGNPQHFYVLPGNAGQANRLALTNDGIFAVGQTPRTAGSSDPPYYFAVARLNANGALDARFGGGGRSYGSFTATGDLDTSGIGIAVGNGGVMVAGTQEQASTGNGNTRKFAIGRLQYDQVFSDGFE
jgi:uncharacterized delta-60 repeat protein